MLFTLISCSKKNQDVVEKQSDEEVAAAAGISFSVPDSAKYATYSVVNTHIGEARFTFNSIVFVYCGSKLSAGESLHRVKGKAITTTTLTIDTRATVSVDSYQEGWRLASWNYKGTNYSLFTEKAVSDDTITELCDLLIK
jgi:hypothetical protein